MRTLRVPHAGSSSGAWLFSCALAISFLGTLPIGTLNVSVAGLAIHKGWTAAAEFALAAILVEVILVRIALMAVKKLEGLKHLYRFFSIVTCFVLLLFAWTSLEAAFYMHKFGATLPFTGQIPFISGLLLSLINPLHLPFWMGWTAVLRSKKILGDTPGAYNLYVIAIGTGTSLAFFAYGLAGSLLIRFLEERQGVLNWIVGFALLLTALLQLYKTFCVRSQPVKI